MIEIAPQQDALTSINIYKELHILKQSVALFNSFEHRLQIIKDFIDTQDADFIQEAEDLAFSLNEDINKHECSLLLNEEHDGKSAFVSVNSGAGGTESNDWARMLYKMVVEFSASKNFKVSLLDIQPGSVAGLKHCHLLIEGASAYGYLKALNGIHKLQRVSPFGSKKEQRHTSFASISVIPEIEEADEIKIRDEDLKIDTYRSSGAGGQHVNKTDSAVRITHLPSGLVVACQEDRSQYRNKATALRVLKARLAELSAREHEERQEKILGQKKKNEFGNHICSYSLHPYQLVKDNRTGYSTASTDDFLNGKLESFIQAYLFWNKSRSK